MVSGWWIRIIYPEMLEISGWTAIGEWLLECLFLGVIFEPFLTEEEFKSWQRFQGPIVNHTLLTQFNMWRVKTIPAQYIFFSAAYSQEILRIGPLDPQNAVSNPIRTPYLLGFEKGGTFGHSSSGLPWFTTWKNMFGKHISQLSIVIPGRITN